MLIERATSRPQPLDHFFFYVELGERKRARAGFRSPKSVIVLFKTNFFASFGLLTLLLTLENSSRGEMAKSFEEMIASCDIFAGCDGVDVLPSEWRGADGQLEKLVIFGYGSVIWKPGIEFEESHVGYINGFIRRMWQGNETHRGRKGRPGRVATLLPKPNKRTFGKAFVLKSKEQIEAAMDHLIMREISLGGYCLGFTPFHRFDDGDSSSCSSSPLSSSPSSSSSISSSPSSSSLSSMDDDLAPAFSTVPALVFSATTDNEYYLGPEKMSSMAETIARAEGPSGHNLEYLVKICDFMREELPPDIGDNHLFRLEKLTLKFLAERGVNYQPLAYPELFNRRDVNNNHVRGKLNASSSRRTLVTDPPTSPLKTKHRGDKGKSKTDAKASVKMEMDQESDGIGSESNSSSSDSMMDTGVTGRNVSNRRRWQRRRDLNQTLFSPEQ